MRFLSCLLSVSALFAFPQDSPDAHEILLRSGGLPLSATTFRIAGTEVTESVPPGVQPTTAFTFTGSLASGGRLHWESKSGDSGVLQIADGRTLWTYVAATKGYTQTSAPNGMIPAPVSTIWVGRDATRFSQPRVEREESLDFDDKPVACYVVRANYIAMPGYPGAKDVVRTVWVAKSNYLILRDVWEFSAQFVTRVTTDYNLIESGPLADTLFLFTAPEGSHPASPPQRTAAPPGFSQAVVLRKVDPEYSAEARAAGYQGTVSLYTEVNADGKPTNVQVIQGLGLGLDERAVEAIKQWEFKPNHNGGEIQDAREVQFQFRLDAPAPWYVASEVYWDTLPANQRRGDIVKPSPKHYVAPDAAACLARGKTVVGLTIGKEGIPHTVRFQRGDQGPLSDAAVKAVEAWRFSPLLADGRQQESQGEVEFVCRPLAAQPEIEATAPTYHIGGGVTAPVVLFKTEPEYSEAARKAKYQGSMTLYVRVSADGAATDLRVIRMLGLGLDEKAMEAVKRWRFKPAMKDGKPVNVDATIEVSFRLL